MVEKRRVNETHKFKLNAAAVVMVISWCSGCFLSASSSSSSGSLARHALPTTTTTMMIVAAAEYYKL